MAEKKKYVVVLAHADGWGALSANKVVKHLHDHHPEVGIFLVVSQATKKDGKILTKLEDLKTPRELKETNLLEYFHRIDAMHDAVPDEAQRAGQYTFNQLAKRYCDDHVVHYTTKGGPKGGEEVAAFFKTLEEERGITPEVVLSVDTMAILPAEITGRYHCFSTHPGPLDTVKVEGMQGTLRSLVSQVLYDGEGAPLPADHVFGMGMAYAKGTLFMQHPELDKGPPVVLEQAPVVPGMCAYQLRDEVYHALTDAMLERLPVFLDKDARTALVEKITREKAEADKLPHRKVPELEAGEFATWQGKAVGFASGGAPHGVEVVQNEVVNPQYFKNQMRCFFPGAEAEFDKTFAEVYGSTLEKVAAQKKDRMTDPWARYFSGDKDVVIRQYDPKTGDVIAEYSNKKPGQSK